MRAGQARTDIPTLAESRPGIEPGASWSQEASIRLRECARECERSGFESIAPSDDPPLAPVGLLPHGYHAEVAGHSQL